MTFKQRLKTDKTYASTLAKILPGSRLFAYRLLLEKAKLEEPESVSAARLKRRTA